MRPQFEQAIAKCTRVRQTESGAVLEQKLDQAGIVGEDIDGPRFDLEKTQQTPERELKVARKRLKELRDG